MIDDNSENTSPESDDPDEISEVSKSQRKREADAVRDLGVQLSELSARELATMPLPDDVLAAVQELNRIKAHGAKKRQLGFLAKRMRHIDVTLINDALEKLRQTARAHTRSLHQVEHWRDRLVGDVEGESPKEALTVFLDEFSHADRQQFRHLQRQSLAERAAKKPPTATRQLFKAMRSVIIDGPVDE